MTRATASALATPGGVIAHIGQGEDTGGPDIGRMTLQEITFIGTYTNTGQDFRETCAAMFAGCIGPLDRAETQGLSTDADAFADIRAGCVAAPRSCCCPRGEYPSCSSGFFNPDPVRFDQRVCHFDELAQ